MDHSHEGMDPSVAGTHPSPRRGPSVDIDPHGIVTGKSPDRQRRQFLNDSFLEARWDIRQLFKQGGEQAWP